jgi:uncharacterized protein (DUF2141 family)
VLFIITFTTAPLLADPNKGDLSIKITGTKNNKGKLIVYVYRRQDDIYKSKPYLINQTKVHLGKGKVNFKNLPFDHYSVMAFHDVNNNNTMDHNFLKLPIEPFGFSNNWNFSLLSGKPTFNKTNFSFTKDRKEIQIRVK